MSQLIDIYNSLMNDPDIVPPKKVSKDKYVWNMAQQRIQQHEHNAEALEMGFTKTLGHFSNGKSNSIGFQSAVSKLAQFVTPPEPSADTAMELLLEKAAKRWWKEGDYAGGNSLNITAQTVEDLREKGHSRSEIADLVRAKKGAAYGISDARMVDQLDPDEVQRRIAANEYSKDEIADSPNLQRFAALAGTSVDDTSKPDTATSTQPRRIGSAESSPDLAERLKAIDPAFNKANVIDRLKSAGYTPARLKTMSDDNLVIRARIRSDNLSYTSGDIDKEINEVYIPLMRSGHHESEIVAMDNRQRNQRLTHLRDNPEAKKADLDAEVKRQKDESAARVAEIADRAKSEDQKNVDRLAFAGIGYTDLHINQMSPQDVRNRLEQMDANPSWKKDDIENKLDIRKPDAVASPEVDVASPEVDVETDSNVLQIGGDAKVGLSDALSGTGLKAMLDKIGKGEGQLWNHTMKPTTDNGRKKGTGSNTQYQDYKGDWHKKQEDAIGGYVKTKSDARNYILDLQNPEHEHHGYLNEIKDMPVLDEEGNPTGQKVGTHIGISEPDLGKIINPPVEAKPRDVPQVASQPTPEQVPPRTDLDRQGFKEDLGRGHAEAGEDDPVYKVDLDRLKGLHDVEQWDEVDRQIKRLKAFVDKYQEHSDTLIDFGQKHGSPPVIGAENMGIGRLVNEASEGSASIPQKLEALDKISNMQANVNIESIMNDDNWDSYISGQPVAADVEGEGDETPVETTTEVDDSTVASVPIMITNQMIADLKAKGYSEADIDKMKPEEAHANLQAASAVATPLPSAESDTAVETGPKLGFNANSNAGKRLVALGYDPETSDVNHLRSGDRLTSSKIKEEEDKQKQDVTDQKEEDGNAVTPDVLTSTDKELSSIDQLVANSVLKTDRAVKQARMVGLADANGNLTPMGHELFERLSPLVGEAIKQFASPKGKQAIKDHFGLKRSMQHKVKADGELEGVGGTFMNHLIAAMNDQGANLQQVYNEDTGELQEGKEHNELGSLDDVLNGDMVRHKLLSSARAGEHGMEYPELLKVLTKLETDELIGRGADPQTAEKLVADEQTHVEAGMKDGTISLDNLSTEFQSNVNQAAHDQLPDIAEAKTDWGKTIPGSTKDMFEGQDLPMPTGIPTSTADEAAEEGVQEKQRRIGPGIADQPEIPGFKEALSDAAFKTREKNRRAKLTPRERKVEDLKKVMHGDAHEHLDNPDDMSDSDIDKLYKDKVITPKMQTKDTASADSKPKGGKAFNRVKSIEKLARLQNPHLDPESDDFKQALADLHEDYDEEYGVTDKDVGDALKSQMKLSANQASQQNQEKQNRATGADSIRAIADFEDNFQDPAKWAEEHDGEEMSPEMAKEHIRDLIDFQHRAENFAHFGPKTGDPENFKALRARLNEYSKLNPAATREIAAEVLSAQREGIEVGSDEFLAHAKELKETAEREERTTSANADNKQEKLAHALENGNFSRGYDEEGNEGHRNLDHNGNPEHDTSEREHEDGKAPRVHSVDADGYSDPEVQGLVDEIHDARLATPKADRERRKAVDQLHGQNIRDLQEHQTHASAAHFKNNDERAASHEQNEATHKATHADIDQRERDGEDARASQVQDAHNTMLTDHNTRVNEQTETHDKALDDHDDATKAKQAEYDKHHKTIEKANEAHSKVVGDASTDRINTIDFAERDAEKETTQIHGDFAKASAKQLETHTAETEQHNQAGRDMLANADAEFAWMGDEHQRQMTELQNDQKQVLDSFQQRQEAEFKNASKQSDSAYAQAHRKPGSKLAEELNKVRQRLQDEAAEFEQGQAQEVAALQQDQNKEIVSYSHDKILGLSDEWEQASEDMQSRHQGERQELSTNRDGQLERTNAVLDYKKATARTTESTAVNESTDTRNAALQSISDAEGLGVTVEDDDDVEALTAKVGEAQSSHETDSAATRGQMEEEHGDSIESQRRGLKSKQGKLFAQAQREAVQDGRDHDSDRSKANSDLQYNQMRTKQAHENAKKTIQDAHDAAKVETTKAHGEAVSKLEASKKPTDEAHNARLETAIQALKDKFPDDLDKVDAILNKNPHVGQSSEQAAAAHEEAGSGPTGEKDADGEDKKPEKSRMVKDPKTGDMKKQYWIPGRGKGWVDEDTYNASHGQNADAAKNGKMMVYPKGHFDAGHGKEGEEDFRPPSPAMAGHGANMFSIHTDDHPDKGLHDDELDHDGVAGRHLGNQSAITGHANFEGGEPYSVDLNAVNMAGLAESAGKGKGKARDPEGFRAKAGRKLGELASLKTDSKFGSDAKPFEGAVKYMAEKLGVKGGEKKSTSQHLANAMRGGRQAVRKKVGGAYIKGHKPQNKKEASLQSEMWRRLPKPLRAMYNRSNPEHAKELDHIKDIEDRQERKSSMDQFQDWHKGIENKVAARPDLKKK